MPPVSVSTTLVLRMRSRSEVLPWSTWPRMVITGGRGWSFSEALEAANDSSSSSSAVRFWTTSRPTPNSAASRTARSSSMVALMVKSWFIAISLRSRSPAFTPMASERPRTVIGGSISAWDLRVGARAVRGPPRDFLIPERVRRTSSSSVSSAVAGTATPPRRSPARSLRRARRPARSAAEPRRAPLDLRSSSSSSGTGGSAARPAPAPARRTAGPPAAGAPVRDAPGGGPPRWGWPTPRPAAGAPLPGAWKAFRPPERIRARSSSRVIDFSGRWTLADGEEDAARDGPLGRWGGAIGAATEGRGRLGPRGASRRPPPSLTASPGRRAGSAGVATGAAPRGGSVERIPAEDMYWSRWKGWPPAAAAPPGAPGRAPWGGVWPGRGPPWRVWAESGPPPAGRFPGKPPPGRAAAASPGRPTTGDPAADGAPGAAPGPAGRARPDGEEPGTRRWGGGPTVPPATPGPLGPAAAAAPAPGLWVAAAGRPAAEAGAAPEPRAARLPGDTAAEGPAGVVAAPLAPAARRVGTAVSGAGPAGRPGSTIPRAGAAAPGAGPTPGAVAKRGAPASVPAPGCFINARIRSTIAGSRLARALTLTSRPSF